MPPPPPWSHRARRSKPALETRKNVRGARRARRLLNVGEVAVVRVYGG
ncbi:hypothetical protein V6Z11_D07G112700 [Gossypium hirsutum]